MWPPASHPATASPQFVLAAAAAKCSRLPQGARADWRRITLPSVCAWWGGEGVPQPRVPKKHGAAGKVMAEDLRVSLGAWFTRHVQWQGTQGHGTTGVWAACSSRRGMWPLASTWATHLSMAPDYLEVGQPCAGV